jgi:hypothetical protein
MKKDYVFCEDGTEILNIISINFRLQGIRNMNQHNDRIIAIFCCSYTFLMLFNECIYFVGSNERVIVNDEFLRTEETPNMAFLRHCLKGRQGIGRDNCFPDRESKPGYREYEVKLLNCR